MPVLPVSDFWQRSFAKYYKLRWIQQDLWGNKDIQSQTITVFHSVVVKYNVFVMVTMALILYIGVLLIPLSLNTSFNSNERSINPHLYVTYQTVYTLFCYPCIIQIFEIALPTTVKNKLFRYILLPIPIFLITTGIYIVYSPIVPNIKTGQQYSRTLGPFIQSWYAAIIFFGTVYTKSCYDYFNKPDIAANNVENNENNADHNTDVHYRNISIPFSKDSISFSINSLTQNSKRGTTQDFTGINSTILYEYSELSDDSNFGEDIEIHVNNPKLQVIFAIFTMGCLTGTYYWTQYITWKWQKGSDHNKHKTLWDEINYISYPVFWFVMYCIKFVTARFARYCDSNKTSMYSLELIMIFFITCFYYVFYRNLFLHITSYEYFIFIKVLHIGLELLTYPLRMSKYYFNKTERLQNKLNNNKICCGLLQPFIWILYDPSEYHIWCVRICIDYTINFIVSIGSGIAYIVGVLWLRYGYNQYFYDIKDIDKDQFDKALVFTAIAICIELIVYLIIDIIMKYVYEINVVKHWKVLIKNRPGYIWYFIFMLQHVQTDVMIAKLINV